MTRAGLRDAAELVGSVLLMMFAALVAILSTVAIIVLIPANMLIVAGLFGGSGFPARGGDFVFSDLQVIAWFPAALLVAVRNCVDSLAVFTDPDVNGAAQLAAWSVAVLLTFPPLWGFAL